MSAPIVEQTDEATKTTQVPELQGPLYAGPAQPVASAVLFEASLPEGQQGRQPAPLAPITPGLRLLPMSGERAASAGVAAGASGLLA